MNPIYELALNQAVCLVFNELEDATEKYGAFASGHEGYAIIKEELEELWEEVKNHQKDGATGPLTDEAVQVAAMSLRFLMDVCSEEVDRRFEEIERKGREVLQEGS